MTDPQYINELAALYTRMHKHPGEERPLTEKFGPPTKPNREVVSDDEPKWKELLRKSYQDKKDAVVADVPKEAEECEEENTKASLAIKLVRELLDEEEHNEAAANAIYFIRDLVK